VEDVMQKKLFGVFVTISLSLVSVTAFADPPAATTAPAAAAPAQPTNVKVLKTVWVYGRRQLPSVVIEIQRLSAAHEAAEAHESLHNALVESSVPAALRQQ
jgi:hypothetical protein